MSDRTLPALESGRHDNRMSQLIEVPSGEARNVFVCEASPVILGSDEIGRRRCHAKTPLAAINFGLRNRPIGTGAYD